MIEGKFGGEYNFERSLLYLILVEPLQLFHIFIICIAVGRHPGRKERRLDGHVV